MTRLDSGSYDRLKASIALAALPALHTLGWATAAHGRPSVFWPSVAVAWFLLAASPRRHRVLSSFAIFGSAAATGSWFGVPLGLGLAEGAGDVVGGLVVAALMPSSHALPVQSLRREGSLWMKALAVTVASTFVVAAFQLGAGSETWSAEVLPRFMARLTGAACVGPFLRASFRSANWRRLFELEALAVGCSLAVTGAAAYQGGPSELAFVFVVMMPLLWAALRLEEPVPQAAVLAVALVSVVAARLGYGLFVGPEAVLGLQAWLSYLAMTTLLVSAVTAERRVAYSALAQSEKRFRLMTENGRDLVSVHELGGTFLWASASTNPITGWSAEELLGKSFIEFVHADDRSLVENAWRRVSGKLSTPSVRYRFRTKDGRQAWLETTAQLLDDSQTVQCATRDITLRMRALERLRLACQSAGVVVFDWDLVRDRVVDEGRFHELLGVDISQGPSIRTVYLRCVHPEDRHRVVAELQAALTGDRPYRTRYRTLHPLKGERHIFASGEFERDEQGRAVAMIGVNWDVTEQARVEEALRAARDAAEAASRAKAAYLAMMSHEIRTPLGGLIGLTEALGFEVGPAHQPTVDTIRRSGEALLAVLNDVLDLSKMEAGKLELEARLCELEMVLGDVRSLYWRTAHAKGLGMSVEIEPEADRLVADPLRLRQVLSNLVSNAIKFTEEGGVSLHARATAPTPGALGGRLILTVSDTGIGIPEDRLERLFQDFSQVDVSTSRRYGGTGLGLAISKRLVTAMGGTITVSSVPGQGTSFTVELPRGTPEQLAAALAAQQAADGAPSAEGLRGLRVLLAEDNPINRRVAVGLLERLGCRVTAVENGHEAVEAWRRSAWEVVVMDMQMPELDGLEAARLIRTVERQDGRAPTPIVAMTANAFAEDRQACLDAGMDDVLTKPASRAALQAALTRLVERRGEPLRATA